MNSAKRLMLSADAINSPDFQFLGNRLIGVREGRSYFFRQPSNHNGALTRRSFKTEFSTELWQRAIFHWK